MEVQSDFAVALKIREANGKVHTIARYESSRTEMEGEGNASAPVPHLHRLDPTGTMLASFDPGQSTIQLRSPNADGLGVAREVHIDGLEGNVRQFRWLESIEGFAVATDDDVYIVPVHFASIGDGGSVHAQADSIFPAHMKADAFEIRSIRALPSGLMVHSRATESWVPRGQVHHVRIADDTVQELTSVVPRHYDAIAANVGAGGTIRVAVGPAEDIEMPEIAEDEDVPTLWTFAPAMEGAPARTDVHDCGRSSEAEGDDASEIGDQCYVSNWVPGSEALVYAGPNWNNSPIVVNDALPGKKDLKVHLFTDDELSDNEDAWGYSVALNAVDTLWTSHDESKLMAANARRLRVWDMSGKVLWTWTPPNKQLIHGAHFDRDDQAVIVSVGKSVYRVDDGKAKRLVKNRTKYKARTLDSDYDAMAIPGDDSDWGGEAESFVDQAIALPGGAIAYTVVDLEQRYIESDFGFDYEAELLEMEAAEELADPFAEAAAGL